MSTKLEGSIDNVPHDVLHGKGLKIGRIQLPPYRSPLVQIIMVGFVCFLCPGMFNALQGMGGAGQSLVGLETNNKALIGLYSTFAVVGFFAGTIQNRLGTRLTLAIGGFGYALYTASFLSYNHTQNAGFVIFSGTLLGICASMLWCAQGLLFSLFSPFPPYTSLTNYA